MSTYDDASLIYYPSGYKAGKAYSLKPTDGTGDLTFTRASTATRVNEDGLIESVATGVPRIDFTGGGCGKLLLEPQRTNLVLRSEEFDNASWTKNTTTVTANSTTSPDGNINADKLIVNNGIAISGSYIQQSITKAGSSIIYSYNLYAKASEINGVRVYARDSISAANFAQVFYNINDGSVITAATTGGLFSSASSTITSAANGFYRINLTFTSSVDTQLQFRIYPFDTVKTTGNGTDGIFVYGAQLEAGSYPTSYIPTTTTAVTRVADSATKTGISSLIGQTEGTMFIDFTATDVVNTNAISLNSANGRIMIFLGANLILTQVRVLGVSQFSASTAAIAGSRYKAAIAYKLNDFAFYLNGVQVATSNVGTIPTCDVFSFDATSGSTPFIGKIQSSMLFKTRLSNAELATLTTL